MQPQASPGNELADATTLARILSPLRNARAIGQVAGLIATRRELVAELAYRDMGAAHRSHSLGHIWIYVHPILIALIFMTIFGIVLGARLNLPKDFPGDYSSYILIGLIPWLMTQAALVRGTSALTSNVNLIKQVVFPIEVLPLATIWSGMLPFVPAFLMMIAYSYWFAGSLPWTLCLIPVVLVMHLALVAGAAFALSAITVFVRDVREFVSVFCVIAMYITPAVYLPQWVPAPLRPALWLNPFSYLVWVYQDTFFYGAILHPEAWAVLAVMSFVALAGGWRLFRRLKPFYGNVL